jgi:hypothetical protein
MFCPPVPVTFNAVPIGRITDELVQRPWVAKPRSIDNALEDRQPRHGEESAGQAIR